MSKGRFVGFEESSGRAADYSLLIYRVRLPHNPVQYKSAAACVLRFLILVGPARSITSNSWGWLCSAYGDEKVRRGVLPGARKASR